MSIHNNKPMLGEKEYKQFMQKKVKKAKIFFWLTVVSMIPIPILVLVLPDAPFLGIILITFLPIFLFGGNTWIMWRRSKYKGNFFYIGNDEVFIWSTEGCLAITEKDILNVELRSWKNESIFVGLPKNVKYVRSRTRDGVAESTRYKVVLKNKDEYASQEGRKETVALLPGWIKFYSNSESEKELKKMVVGRRTKKNGKVM